MILELVGEGGEIIRKGTVGGDDVLPNVGDEIEIVAKQSQPGVGGRVGKLTVLGRRFVYLTDGPEHLHYIDKVVVTCR